MAENRFGSYPLPAWLQSYMERNIGRRPLWEFPRIPDSPDGLSFDMLGFENRHFVLDMFENDPDPWVDERFEGPKQLYEYVAHRHALFISPSNNSIGNLMVQCTDFSNLPMLKEFHDMAGEVFAAKVFPSQN